ncbi:MAG: hypothetical protein JNJ73_16830 [Hyphomonadaceae bacterium]|nr:hypothetical protein [Hyphomonadaceae bacterium]
MSLLVRALAAGLALAWAAGALVVFEAAFKTDLALRATLTAQTLTDRGVRDGEYEAGADFLARSWANPLAWHAGANEAYSFIAAALAAGAGNQEMEQAAVAHATRAVDLSPVQPAAWARLAAFGHAGRPVSRCDVAACLDRSWASGPLTNAGIECARMRIAYEIGRLPPGDPRFAGVNRAMTSTRDFAQCFAFLPREQLFQVLMMRAGTQLEEQRRRGLLPPEDGGVPE